MENDFYRQHYEKSKERRKAYRSKRKEKLGVVTLELSHLALVGLSTVAAEKGVSRASVLNRLFEGEAKKRGLEYVPPAPVVSQVVTKDAQRKTPANSQALQNALAEWEDGPA